MLGSWIPVYCSLVLTVENEFKTNTNIYHISMTYRKKGTYDSGSKVRGHVLGLRRGTEEENKSKDLPKTDCAMVMDVRTSKGKEKKYLLCTKNESVRDKFVDVFNMAEQLVKQEVQEEPCLKIATLAADSAKTIQNSCMVDTQKHYDELEEIYKKVTDNVDNPEHKNEILKHDQKLLHEVLSLFNSVKDHHYAQSKTTQGGTLQTKRIKELVRKQDELLQLTSSTGDDLLGCFLIGHQHREIFLQMIALSCIVIQDFQFGMEDLDKYRIERAKVLKVKDKLYGLEGWNVEDTMKVVLSPPQSKKKKFEKEEDDDEDDNDQQTSKNQTDKRLPSTHRRATPSNLAQSIGDKKNALKSLKYHRRGTPANLNSSLKNMALDLDPDDVDDEEDTRGTEEELRDMTKTVEELRKERNKSVDYN